MRFSPAAILLTSATLLAACGGGGDAGDPTSPAKGTLTPELAADVMQAMFDEMDFGSAIASIATLPTTPATVALRQMAPSGPLPDITIDTTLRRCSGGGTIKYNARSNTPRPIGGNAVADLVLNACTSSGDLGQWTIDSDPSLRNTIDVTATALPQGGTKVNVTMDLVGNLRYRGDLATGRCATNMRWTGTYTLLPNGGLTATVRAKGDLCGLQIDVGN